MQVQSSLTAEPSLVVSPSNSPPRSYATGNPSFRRVTSTARVAFSQGAHFSLQLAAPGSPAVVSLMGYKSPSNHDIQELEHTLKTFEDYYHHILASVQMDLHKRDPRKIAVQEVNKSLVPVNLQEGSSWSLWRKTYNSSPEEVIKLFETVIPKHENFISRVSAFSRSLFSKESTQFLNRHSQLLRKIHARLIQARDAHPKEPHVHRQYAQLAERILQLELCSRPDIEEGLLGSSYSSSRLLSSMRLSSMRRNSFRRDEIPPPSDDHVAWVKKLFGSIKNCHFTDENRGGLLQLSTVLGHFDDLSREGKEKVASHFMEFLKRNFNIDLQNYKRPQVFSPGALDFLAEIVNTILPTMGLECDDWVAVPLAEFPEETKDLLEELQISLLVRDGKCVVFSKSLEDFGVTDGYVRSHVNTSLGAVTSELDSEKLEKYLQLSKPLVAFFQKRGIMRACFSGILCAGAYMQLLRYQAQMDSLANHQETHFCGIFRGAVDYLPLYSRFSQLDNIRHQCEDTDLLTHHIDDTWALKTPELTTVPGATLSYKADFTSLGVADRTLNSRDPSRYIFGQDRYIEYFIELMRVCQQLIDKIRPLRFGINEERSIFTADAEALLRGEKTSGILEEERFLDKILSLKAAIMNERGFAHTACHSLEKMPLEVAVAHAERLPLYRQVELYLETGNPSHLKGFTRLSDYYYGIQDTDGNTVIFCTGIYNTPVVAGPSSRGINGFPVSTTMESSYCSRGLCDRIQAFCGPNPTTYIGCGAAADSISVMARVHKNLSIETPISVVCFAPRLGDWGPQYRTTVDTDKRLRIGENDRERVDIVSILSTDDSYGDSIRSRLENRGLVLTFNRVNEPSLSNAAAFARGAAAAVATVEREDFSPYFGPSIRCLERYVALRQALNPVFIQRKDENSSSPTNLTRTSGVDLDEMPLSSPTAREIIERMGQIESMGQRYSVWPTKGFKHFLEAYGQAFGAVEPRLDTTEKVRDYLSTLGKQIKDLHAEKSRLEVERQTFIHSKPAQEALLEERERGMQNFQELKIQVDALKMHLEVAERDHSQTIAFLNQNKETIQGVLKSLYQRNASLRRASASRDSSGNSRRENELRAFNEMKELYVRLGAQMEVDPCQLFPEALYKQIHAAPGCPEVIKELVEAQFSESALLEERDLKVKRLSQQKTMLEQQMTPLLAQQNHNDDSQEDPIERQESVVQRIREIVEKLQKLYVEQETVCHNLDIGDDALQRFAVTAIRLPAYTRVALIQNPRVREAYAALQARYLFGKSPEQRLAFLAEVGEFRFAANSQNGARLVRDLATGKYAVVFKPVKSHLSWADYIKRKGGQISHTLVRDGGMREMEQLHELWAQVLGQALGVGCTLTQGGMVQLAGGERGVALPFLTGYRPASQHQELLNRLYRQEEIGKVHDFFAINIISGDQDGHFENWMLNVEDGALRDVRWIDAGNAFTWNDPTFSWRNPSSWWAGFSPNYRAWKSLPISQKPFEGAFSRASLRKKLPTYDYAGVQSFAGTVVDNFRRGVHHGRFQELLREHGHTQEHFELLLTRMQRRLEALLLYICTNPRATPAGAAAYTHDQPQTWTRFNDWSVESFIQNNKNTPFVN